MTQANGIKFVFSQSGKYWTIIGATDGMQFAASIPEKIDGYPVAEVGEKAFWVSKTLTGIILPSTIKIIGKSAFANCTRLKYVSFSETSDKNLTIDENAFLGCTALARFQANKRRAMIHPHAFAKCENLHYIDVFVKTLAAHSFSDCQNLDAIIFANKAKISSRCIQNCTVKHIAFEGDAIIADTEAFLEMFSGSKVFATEKFSYWDLVYEGLNIAPRQTIE